VRGFVGIGGAIILAAVVWTAPGLSLHAQDIRFFRIGTGATSSTYFPIGGVIASAVSNPPGSRDCEVGGSCGVAGLIAVAQTTAGAVANVEAVASGALESGLTQSDVAHWAFTGKGIFEKKGALGGLRAIANLYQESLHIVVRRDSGITSFAKLRNKRVSLGEKESGSMVTAILVLRALGLSEKRVKAVYLSTADAAAKMRKGELDAFFAVGGAPIPAIAELAGAIDIDLLPLLGEKVSEMRAAYPFLTIDVIPAESYRGVKEAVTVGIGTIWVVRKDIEPELAYGLTKALWHPNTRRLLDASHPIGREIRFDTALSGLPIPLHPGAAKYYSEAAGAAEAPAD
jgi:TRAP transporter TAXI family solute receptor